MTMTPTGRLTPTATGHDPAVVPGCDHERRGRGLRLEARLTETGGTTVLDFAQHLRRRASPWRSERTVRAGDTWRPVTAGVPRRVERLRYEDGRPQSRGE